MNGAEQNMGSETAKEVAAPPTGGFDLLSTLADVKARLDAVEASNKTMRAELDAARSRGDVGLNLEQIAHVMQKYFPHDMPAPDAPPPQVAKFDPYTGAPLAN